MRTGRTCRHLCVIAVLWAASTTVPTAQEPARQVDSAIAETEVVTAPVVLDGQTLFRVRGATSYPAEIRAQNIARRIEAIAADRSVSPDLLKVLEIEGVTWILAGDRQVMGVADADASVEQLTRADLAASLVIRVRQAILDYRQARSAEALRRAALAAAGATIAWVLALGGILWMARRADRLLHQLLQKKIQSVGIQTFEIVRAERIWSAIRGVQHLLRVLAILVVTFAYASYTLALFPWTRALAENLTGLVIGPLATMGRSLVSEIPDLIFLAVLFVVLRFAVRLIRMFFDAVSSGGVTLEGFDPQWATPTFKIVRLAIIAFGLVVAYPYIPGSSSDAFKGVSLFAGIVFSLGSSSAIANIVAGYMLTYRRAFKIGDRVQIGDHVGDVVQMRLQVTHLRSLKNEELIIPNSQILNATVVNYTSLSHAQGLILHTEVGIGYETPWRQVEAMLMLAAERTPGLLSEPRPFILQTRLGDFAVTYELNVYCDNASAMKQLYTELHRQILDVFNEYGVQIMTPAYEGDPAEPKVVAKKDWHAAPATPAAGPSSRS